MASKKAPAVAPGTPAKSGGFSIGGVSEKQLTQFTTQLSTLQDAGLPIVSCLKILEGQLPKGFFKNVLYSVTDDVESGSSLSEDRMFSSQMPLRSASSPPLAGIRRILCLRK